jgi:iron complex outermembrane receptor protein
VEVLPGTIFDPALNPMSPHQVGDNIKELFVLPYAPRNSLNLSADYTFLRFGNGELSLNLNYRRQSNSYLSAPAGPAVEGREYYRQDGYGVLDARLTMALEFADARSLQLALWGRNVTDRDYRQHVIGLGGGGAVATPISAKGYTYAAESWAEPATYGVEVIFEY